MLVKFSDCAILDRAYYSPHVTVDVVEGFDHHLSGRASPTLEVCNHILLSPVVADISTSPEGIFLFLRHLTPLILRDAELLLCRARCLLALFFNVPICNSAIPLSCLKVSYSSRRKSVLALFVVHLLECLRVQNFALVCPLWHFARISFRDMSISSGSGSLLLLLALSSCRNGIIITILGGLSVLLSFLFCSL